LQAAGYKNLTDFTRVSEEEFLRLHGMGPKAVCIIVAAWETQGLCFANLENSDKISEKAKWSYFSLVKKFNNHSN